MKFIYKKWLASLLLFTFSWTFVIVPAYSSSTLEQFAKGSLKILAALLAPREASALAAPDPTIYTVNSIPWNFIDISAGGTELTPVWGDDAAMAGVPIGFGFEFYGSIFNSVTVTSNGYLSFSTLTYPQNAPIPSQDTPNSLIAPFWDDLNPEFNAVSAVYFQTLGTAPNRVFVVQWTEIPLKTDPDSRLTFEVLLFEGSNEIQFHYLTLADGSSETGTGNVSGSSATIGIENGDGSLGAEVSFNKDGAVTDASAFSFTLGGNAFQTGHLLGDLDSDGRVTILDQSVLTDFLTHPDMPISSLALSLSDIAPNPGTVPRSFGDGLIDALDHARLLEVFMNRETLNPTLSESSEVTAVPGNSITLSGSGFDPAAGNNSVVFIDVSGNETAVTADSINADGTELTVTIPSGIEFITKIKAISSGLLSNALVYVPQGAPIITRLLPASGYPGNTVLIRGHNFAATAEENAVSFSGIAIDVASLGADWLTVTVPQGAASGPVAVTVAGQTSNAVDFEIPVPFITSLSPARDIVGSTVLIRGHDFGRAAGKTPVVTFNGVDATVEDVFVEDSLEVIRVTVPAGATSGPVTVTVACQTSNAVNFEVRDLEAFITSPALDSELTAPTDVIGTAWAPAFAYYTLSYKPADAPDSAYVEFARSNTPVEDDVLGTFDPTRLPNGLYDILLIAADTSNKLAGYMAVYEVTGKLKIGQFSFAFQDMTIPVSGVPITVTRTYNSFDKQKGDFGIGWDMQLGTGVKIQVTRELGSDWCPVAYECQWNVCKYKLVTGRVPKVLVTYADGQQDRFEFRPHLVNDLNPDDVTPSFTPLEGTNSTLEVLGTADTKLQDCVIFDFDVADSEWGTFDPDLFRLTTAEGMVLVISKNDGLESITDHNGNQLTFGPNGIAHSSGLTIGIQRDAQGRIEKITDPMDYEVKYEYDANGDLVGFTDQEDNLTQFGYDSEHNLNSIIDARGIEVLQVEYDDQGRMIGTVDGLGNFSEFQHDMENAKEYVTDRNGNTTIFEYDSDGNIIAETDPLGDVISYTYDERGNQLSKTDAVGNIWEWTYDGKSNKLSETDPLGNTSRWTYDIRGNVLTHEDSDGYTISYSYDAAGNLSYYEDAVGNNYSIDHSNSGQPTNVEDPRGNLSISVYGSAGLPISKELKDANGELIKRNEYTYDLNGNKLSETEYRTIDGVLTPITEEYQYDSLNRLIATINPLGGVSRIEYSPSGKVIKKINVLGNATRYEYDTLNNLVKIRYPDGSAESIAYDAEGNITSKIDRLGREFKFFYNKRNQLIETISPNGSSRHTIYGECCSQVDAVIDAKGNRTEYEYDAAGRITRIVYPEVFDANSGEAVRPETNFEYDAGSKLAAIVDQLGQMEEYQYNQTGRLVRTLHADGTSTQQNYDYFNVISATDEAGREKQFSYDAQGHVISVTLPIPSTGGVKPETKYTYDQTGNLLTKEDALGRITTYTYDELSRMVKRELPGGQSETYTYDAIGNIISYTDFTGSTVAYTYDHMNRLLSKTYQDGSEIVFTYTLTGRIKTVTDNIGTTIYTYDDFDRVSEVKYADGGFIRYSYDVNSNIVKMESPATVTEYFYDSLDRLIRTTDFAGNETTYGYDAAGNLLILNRPNGISTEYVYDSRHRLTEMTHRLSDNSILASYSYSRLPTGIIHDVVEADGSVTTFDYDGLERLIAESRTGTPTYNISYEYDLVGNRKRKASNGIETFYTYDNNDRVLTVSGISYEYDDNGNLIHIKGTPEETTFDYDQEKRLVKMSRGSRVQSYYYDASGNRMEKSSQNQNIRYLVAPINPTGFAQVIEERDDGGTLLARYTYGKDLLSVEHEGSHKYLIYDSHLGTRILTDEAGAQTDSYMYDAYGNLIDHARASVNPYLYSGEQFDPDLGFYYLRARYYNPQLGIFMTMDPYAGSLFQPSSQHSYQYVDANPVNGTDPSGLLTLPEFSISKAIQGALRSISYVQKYCRLGGGKKIP